jgi:copper resistance protein C
MASLLLLAMPGAVAAHAEVKTSTPKDGTTVQGTPTEIAATYTQDLDPDGTSLRLLDPSDQVIAEGIIDPNDVRRMFIDSIPDLAPGDYTVRSTTLSAEDGELDRAVWGFTVEAAPTPSPSPTATPTAAPSATPAPTASPTPTPVPSPTPTPTPSADGGNTGSGGDVVLPIIAAVAILAVGAVWFSRRGRSTTGR